MPLEAIMPIEAIVPDENDECHCLFDIPIELREIIYKRSRFLHTHDKVASLLDLTRRTQAVYSTVHCVEVDITIAPNKRMVRTTLDREF